MNDSLKRIINDSVSGSSELLFKLSRLFSKYTNDIPGLKKLLSQSEKHFKQFAIIIHYVDSVRNALIKKDAELIQKVVASPQKRSYVYKEIFDNALSSIKNARKVFTFSNGRTIFEILIQLNNYHNGKLKVFVTESRPALEGRILSSRLLSENIDVIFGTEAQMAGFILKSDAVFLGADKLLRDGSIVNKTGSLTAAALGRQFKKPVYIFAESAKRSASFRNEEKNSNEVWKKNRPGLKIVNNYLEKVPAEFITGIFTESKAMNKIGLRW